MAKPIGRREFLKKSLFGIGSLIFASSLRAVENATKISSKVFSTPDLPTPDPDLLPLYQQAKEYFYAKRYSEATSLFTQLISNNPATLILYDGLSSVYCAQQNLYAAAELYLQGVNANTNDTMFLHRYALSLRNLCLGNPAKAQQFAVQYNISNLYDYAAQQLILAISLNPKTIYQLDLRDFPRLLEKYNKNPRTSSYPLTLSSAVISQINILTESVSTKWKNSRASKKPAIPLEENYGNNGNGQNKRPLNNKEQKEREKNQKKSKKYVLTAYLKNNSKQNNTAKVEKWGMQILTDDINDTNTVGYIRRYFKKHGNSDRLISLNRYFYNNTENIYTSLALAAALAQYNNDTPSLNEAKQLLAAANQYLNNLTAVGKGAYYISSAKIKIKENNSVAARTILIEGVEKMNGTGGIAYSIMENYAASFDNADKAKAITIQKALCNKQVTPINDPIWTWVEKYRRFLNENQISVTEQIKALFALAKLQKKFNDSGYSATINEINALKNTL